MSNVVKLASKKKKPGIDEWQAQIEEHSRKLMDRLYDQIRLADEEMEDVPEEYADCAILAVFTAMLVAIADGRNALGPEALLKLVEYEIEARTEK